MTQTPDRIWMGAPSDDNHHDFWFEPDEGGTPYLFATPAREAADDLLEALEGLVAANEQWNEAMTDIIGRAPNWSDDYLDAARAAIAKAKGGDA